MRSRWGRPLLVAVAVAGIAAAAPVATRAGRGPDDKADVLLKRVLGAYQKINSLSADMVTEYEFGGQKQKMNGRVVVQKPNMFRMAMGGPQAATFVSNGKSATMYMQAANQYLKMPKEAAGASTSALMGNMGAGLVLDASALKQAKKVEYVGAEMVDGIACEVVKMETEQGEMRLYVQPNLLVRRTAMRTGQGANSASMQTTLRNIVTNKALPASTFVFSPPKGATEMKMPSAANYDARLIKVGKAAPRFALPNPKGGEVSLENTLKGKKAVLVNFWFYN